MYEEFTTVGGESTTKRNEQLLHNINICKWRNFIDKKFDRYIIAFEKNQNKKIFAHFNIGAFFFPHLWLLYRKMFKIAIIFMVLSFVIISSVCIFTSHRVDKEIDELKVTYNEHFYEDGTLNYNSFSYNEKRLYYEITATMEMRNFKVFLSSLPITLISSLAVGFFGDCMYRKHILKHISKSNGSTSKTAVILGLCSTIIFVTLLSYFVFR